MGTIKSKRTSPNSCNYRDMISYYGKIEYYKKFIEKIKQGLNEYISNEESDKILDLLKTKTLSIINTEAFFEDTSYISDICLKIFNESLTLREFFYKLIFEIKKELNKGISSLILTDYFIVLNLYLEKYKYSSDDLLHPSFTSLLELFLVSLATEGPNPITLRLLDGKISRVLFKNQISFQQHHNSSSMPTILNSMYRALKNVKENVPENFNLPEVEIIRSIYTDIRHNQKVYLQEVFNSLDRTIINNAIKGIEDLSIPNSSLELALEYLSCLTGEYSSRDTQSIMLELQRIAKEGGKRSYKYRAELQDIFKNAGISILDAYKVGMKEVYLDLDIFKSSPLKVFSEVKINCKGKTLEEIKVLIKYADILNLLKKRNLKNCLSKNIYKITLTDVEYLQQDLKPMLQERKEKLESLYLHNISFEVQYDPKAARTIAGTDKPEYIRIISDIHADVNEKKRYTFNFGNDFIVNCGDTSGDCETTKNWIRSYMRRGVFVHGNHLGYEYPYSDLNSKDNDKIWGSYIHKDNTYWGQTQALIQDFKSHDDIKYLSNSCIEYDGIVFIGCCLHTDFCLFGSDKQDKYMYFASSRMNDFLRRYTYAECNRTIVNPHLLKTTLCKGHIRRIEPIDYLNKFIKSVAFIKKSLKENKDKPVVLVTHFAPLPFFVEDKYKNDPLSAAFASDLRWLVKENKNIRLIACGHVHANFDFIYEGARCICNPFGYFNENNNKLPYKYGKRVLIKDIKSKNPWQTLLVKEILTKKVKVVTDKDWFLPVQKFEIQKNIIERPE